MLERLEPQLRTFGFIRFYKIENRVHVIEFINNSASYVSQLTLYTNMKARAGTQYPKLFSNEDFLTSLGIARWHTYGAAVCDLCLFAAAQFNKAGRLDSDPSRDAACSMIDDVFIRNDQTDITAKRYARASQIKATTAQSSPIGLKSPMAQPPFNAAQMQFLNGHQLPINYNPKMRRSFEI